MGHVEFVFLGIFTSHGWVWFPKVVNTIDLLEKVVITVTSIACL